MFKKYPFVKQEGYKDCGCACLLMIVRYYKGNISIMKIREMTKTGKNGTSAYNIVNCANTIGFSARGIRTSLNDLDGVILPCIAHVVIDNIYKHYVVVYEINFMKQSIVIGDPDKGIKRISFHDFSSMWTGVLITMYPVRNLPVSKNVNAFSFIFKVLLSYKKEVFFLVLISVGIIILKLVSSFYFKLIIDGVNISHGYLKVIFICFLVLSFIRLVLSFLRSEFLVILNCKLDFNLVADAFKRIILLPYSYYHNRATGEVISKINDFGNVRNLISKICVVVFIDLPLLVISAVFLAVSNFSLFKISFLVLILYVILTFIYNFVFSKYIGLIKSKREDINSYMFESISGFESVKGINIHDRVIDKFNNKYSSLINNIFRLQSHMNVQVFFKDLIGDICNLVVLFVGSVLVFDGKFNIGSLITFSGMMVYFFDPVRSLIDMDVDIKDSIESITRVLSLYEKGNDKGVMNYRNGNIEFRNLCFSFDNKSLVLDNINLSVLCGEHVALTGSSGSGKSTLLKLLMKYYSVDRGMIFIDGIDINDFKVNSIRNNITYVSQSEVLFNDTILNNLSFYSRSDNDIVSVTKIAEFNEILNNDLGLNMLIEENGFNLSGGQRQRIVLARALLKRSKVILIDEGLNQVDISLERKILSNIFSRFKNSTIIVVTHRMENLDLYDRVINLNEGVLCE